MAADRQHLEADRAELRAALERFRSISLDELDERAALLRRIDHKYAVGWEQFLELLEHLQDNHQVLDIDGKRLFAYRTTYFETPDLRCYTDHVEDRLPRFKARTRCYEDSGSCVFEVKLKRAGGEMDKRQVEHPADRSDELTEEAIRCLDAALRDAGLEAPDGLEPRLRTSFSRVSLSADSSSERLTCDFRVRLQSPGNQETTIRSDLVLVETKSERGESPADNALAEAGVDRISLSKYRVGMSLVGGAPGEESQPGSDLFE